MTKYVKLNKEHTEWASALYSMKPTQIRRHSDEDIHKYDWFVVKENKPTLPDRELYVYASTGWKVEDNKVAIDYEPVLRDVESVRAIMRERVFAERDKRLASNILYKGYEISTDESAYKRIMGATIKAMKDQSFTTTWIAVGDEELELDAQEIDTLGEAFVVFEESHIQYAKHLRDVIADTGSPQEVDIKTGWPTREFHSPDETLEVE